jgi:hypothetical protein
MVMNVFWDVALCRFCFSRRFGGTYRRHLQGRKIREWGTSVSRWLQTESPVGNNQLYENREGKYTTWEINREERISHVRHIPEKTFFILTAVKTSNRTCYG